MVRNTGSARKATWDFRGAQTQALTHGLHPYPARMVPGIARELVLRYSSRGDLVYDPFCGSGTTLVEGTIAGRRVIGLDLNPFAVLLSKAKTTPLEPERLHGEWLSMKKALLRPSARGRARGRSRTRGQFLDFAFWYKPYAVRDLSFILAELDGRYSTEGDPVGDFFRVAFARTARDVSNQRPKEFKRWRRSVAELSAYRPSPLPRFVRNVERALPGMAEYYAATGGDVTREVRLDDARDYRPRGRASLVITSPPYGDSGTTVAYGQFSSFALDWLRLSDARPRRLDQQPLGPPYDGLDCLGLSPRLLRTYRKILCRDEARARYMLQFFDGMYQALDRIRSSLRPEGRCCLVVGNRRVRGIAVPTDSILTELAGYVGLDLQHAYTRRVRNKVMPYATKPWNGNGGQSLQPTFRDESILVFGNTQ